MQATNQNLKLVIIGDTMVGKTSFLLRYTDDFYSQDHMATIGLNFKIKLIQHNNRDVRLQIWDTAGQEKFRIMAPAFYKGAKGIVLAYDCTSRSSFDNISNWVEEIGKNNNTDIPKVLVATKNDLTEQKVVTKDMGSQLAQQLGVRFFETSAMTNTNIVEAFNVLVDDIMSRPSSSVIDPNLVSIIDPPDTHKQGGCCASKKPKKTNT